MKADLKVDVAIIGAGTAGLYALREVRQARKSFVLIDAGPLGTTCARVGCMPSKIALHAGHLWSSRPQMQIYGVKGTEHLSIDRSLTWNMLRWKRDQFTDSATNKALNAAGDHLMMGRARYLSPTHIEVTTATGKQIIEAEASIIASGSRPVIPAWLDPVKDRMVTTDTLFELEDLPPRIGILGLGAIGLEMGLAFSRLGLTVIGADLAPTVAGMSDPEIAEKVKTQFGKEMTLWLGNPVSVERTDDGVRMLSGEHKADVDLLLVALGRRPNVDMLGLADAGFPMGDRGMPIFNRESLQIGRIPVFIAGDVNTYRPLMHEAVEEGTIAGYNAVHHVNTRFHRKVPFGIAFTDPDICSVGMRFDELPYGNYVVGSASGEANGRARIMDAQDSLLQIYADSKTGKLLGAAIFAERGEHLAHLLAWSIQREETAAQLLEMPFYHPVMEEMIQSALQEIVRKIG